MVYVATCTYVLHSYSLPNVLCGWSAWLHAVVPVREPSVNVYYLYLAGPGAQGEPRS